MHRIISEIRPRFAIMENVGALTFRGLTDVCGSLAEIGYDAEWQDIRAEDMGAPHRRERIWIVAYPSGEGLEVRKRQPSRQAQSVPTERFGEEISNTPSRREQSSGPQCDERRLQDKDVRSVGDTNFWAIEPDVGRLAHGIPHRVDRLRGLGNAIVPQIAELLFRQIKAHL